MRRAAGWLAALTIVAGVAAGATASPRETTTWTRGFDVSWPQCSGASAHHLPGGSPPFVILGLTDGRGHTANPCFADQVSWARAHGSAIGAYLVPSYPSPAQRAAARTGAFGTCGSSYTCRLRNDGAAQAADALAVMHAAGVHAPMVWVDVEIRPHGWSRHDGHNRAVLRGVLRGLADAHVRAGVYTTSYMWGRITGHWQLRLPNWLPSGSGSVATTERFCGTTGTGGVTWLVQLTHEWDEDRTCPVMDAVPGRPGPLWRYRHTTLSLGSTGGAVSALQRALDAVQTGTYDATTAVAVTQFQADHGLPVNGSFDEDDWRTLGAFRRVGGHPFLLRRMTTR